MPAEIEPFLLSAQAAHNLTDIYEYLAERNLQAAEKIRLEIWQAIQKIADMPLIGHSRRDLTSQPVLFWNVRNFLIIYLPDSRPIEIVAVLHGKRNLIKILQQESSTRGE